jgi:hypothetical protein
MESQRKAMVGEQTEKVQEQTENTVDGDGGRTDRKIGENRWGQHGVGENR